MNNNLYENYTQSIRRFEIVIFISEITFQVFEIVYFINARESNNNIIIFIHLYKRKIIHIVMKYTYLQITCGYITYCETLSTEISQKE